MAILFRYTMPHGKIEQISGVPQVRHARGSDFEHDGHATAGHHIPHEMQAERDVKKMTGKVY